MALTLEEQLAEAVSATNALTLVAEQIINNGAEHALLIHQFLPYNPQRTYKTGEVCTIETAGEVIAMQMYAGPHLTCVNKNPSDLANRHEQWSGAPAPWWWIPYTGNTPGQMSGWLSDTVPEQAVLENEVDLNAQLYWRLANAWPELVSAGVINTRDILGRYTRTADGVDYLVNTTHEDAIRNITGELKTNWNLFDNYESNGAFRNLTGDIEQSPTTSGSGVLGGDFSFDASRIVPTAAQNQPVTSVENKIVFI